jgi:MFS family permease
MTSSSTPFFGWRVVAGAFVLGVFGWGVGFYGPPVYLHAVQEARHWSVVLVSSAVTLHFLVGAVVVANLATLHRRFGLPAVTKAGALLLAVGVLGWAVAREPWQLLLATIPSGAGWVAMSAAAINAIVAPWFVKKRPAALSMAYNGASIGGVIFSPLWVAAIALLDFPLAAAIVGIVMVATVWLLADFFFTCTPETLGQMADGEPATAPVGAAGAAALPGRLLWHDRTFLTLVVAMALGMFAQIGLLAHLFSLIVPAVGETAAGIVMGLATACSIAGRTLVGWLMPPGGDRRLLACASLAVQIAGSLALIAAGSGNTLLMIAGVLLFGTGIGNTTSLPPLIAQIEFARADVQRVVPLIIAISQAGYAFAPAAFGALRSLPAGGATGVFAVAVVIQLLAIAAFLAGRRRQSLRPGPAMP